MPCPERRKEQTGSSMRDNDLKAWALFIVLSIDILLLLQLFGAEWGKIDELTKILGLGGLGAFFQILREKLQTHLDNWKRTLLVAFTLLLLLNLPLYGVHFQVNPEGSTISLIDNDESKKVQPRVYWLPLQKQSFKILGSEKGFLDEPVDVSGWRIFFSLWGLIPKNVDLQARYLVEVEGATKFKLIVDPDKDGKPRDVEGAADWVHLTAGRHQIQVRIDSEIRCKEIVVPDTATDVMITAKDTC